MLEFLKIFSRKRKPHQGLHYKELQAFFDENNLLEKTKRPSFFQEMVNSILPDLGREEYQLYHQAKDEFVEIDLLQRPLFIELINSDFSEESGDQFIATFQASLSRSFTNNKVNSWFPSYWFHVMKAVQKELTEDPDQGKLTAFHTFFLEFEKVVREEVSKYRGPLSEVSKGQS